MERFYEITKKFEAGHTLEIGVLRCSHNEVHVFFDAGTRYENCFKTGRKLSSNS